MAEQTNASIDEPVVYPVVDRHRKPIKPGIPLLLLLGLALWATCAIAYTQFESTSTQILICCLVACIVCAILFCVVLYFFESSRHLFAALLGIVLGLLCASYGALSTQTAAQWSTQNAEEWTFELSVDASESTYGSQAIANATNADGQQVRVQINFKDKVDLLCGDTLRAKTKLKPVSENSSSYYWSRGISATATLASYEQADDTPLSFLRNFRRQAIETFAEYGGDQAGILQALACGYRNTIKETGSYNNYKTVGLAHVIAVSGAHLAIVTTTFEWLLRFLRVRRSIRLILSGAFSVAYLVFAGIPLSAVRAAFMVMLSLGASGIHRRSASLNALALCIITFIVIDPSASVSASFFLSAGSTLGILLFAKLISSWFSVLPKRLSAIVGEPAALTLSSNIISLPYSASLFSQLPLLSLPANIIATPLFTLGCLAGLASAVIFCVFPQLAQYVVTGAAFLAYPLDFVVSGLSSIPYVCIAVDVPLVPMVIMSAVISFVLWITWPKISMRLVGAFSGIFAVLLAAVLFVSPYLHGDEIIMLDVGQGDAFVIRSKGSCILIDTGTQDSLLRSALGREGIYSIDGVILSHSDDDHYGSLPVLSGLVNVDGVYVDEDAFTCECDSCDRMLSTVTEVVDTDEIYGLTYGDTLNVGRFTLQVIWPKSYTDGGENSDSLCLNVTIDCNEDGIVDWTSFFCGDAESEQLQQMVNDGSLGSVDVLKVGHHGSRVALTEDLALTLSPSIALISVGANNTYGHPTDEVLEYLEVADSQIFRTDEQGDVKLTFNADTIYVDKQYEVE